MLVVHPVIRIVCLVCYIVFVLRAEGVEVILSAFFLLILCFYRGRRIWGGLWIVLWRLRWFFLSILFIYFYLTPGYALWSGAPIWLPTVEGVTGGVGRVTALLLVVVAVQLLLLTTERDRLISALYWLAAPLAVLGFPRERLVLRVLLVIDAVEKVRGLLAETKYSVGVGLPRFQRISKSVTVLFQLIVDEVEASELVSVQLNLLEPPSLWQWFFPSFILFLVFY